MVGTDTPNPFVLPGQSVIDELESFVAAGVRPYDALAAATREAARFTGELAVWGTVEPGKAADLLLLEDDPLADIGNLERRVGVMVGGRWLPEAELQLMLADIDLR